MASKTTTKDCLHHPQQHHHTPVSNNSNRTSTTTTTTTTTTKGKPDIVGTNTSSSNTHQPSFVPRAKEMGSFGNKELSCAVDPDLFWGSTLSTDEITEDESLDYYYQEDEDGVDGMVDVSSHHHHWEIPVIDASTVASFAWSDEDGLCGQHDDDEYDDDDDDDDHHHHQSNSFATSSPTSTRQECMESKAAFIFSGDDYNPMHCRVQQDIAMGHHHHHHGPHTTHYYSSGSNSNSGIPPSSMPWIPQPHRRAKSLEADKDFMLGMRKPPRRSRRWTSCPTHVGAFCDEERRLRNRRYLCESSVRQLYEDRKEHILEIFSETWLLTDALKDELL